MNRYKVEVVQRAGSFCEVIEMESTSPEIAKQKALAVAKCMMESQNLNSNNLVVSRMVP